MRAALWVNAIWMAFLWTTRVRNALGDRNLSTGGALVAYGLSAVFLVGAGVLVAVAVLDRRGTELAASSRIALLVGGIGLVHGVVWVIRGIGIAAADHAIGFIVVHLVLATVSVTAGTWLAVRARALRGGFGRRTSRSLRSTPWDSPSASSKPAPGREVGSASSSTGS